MLVPGDAVRSPLNQLRKIWVATHAPVTGVSGRVRIIAYLIPMLALPSSLWRIALCTFHIPIGRGDLGAGVTSSGFPGLSLALYSILLSVVTEIFAFSAIGLVSTWGEAFPRWIPVVGRRDVPRLFAVVPAATGAAILTALWTWVAITVSLGLRINLTSEVSASPLNLHDWKGLVAVVVYAPLLLWGPMLGVITVTYWRRRQQDRHIGIDPSQDEAGHRHVEME